MQVADRDALGQQQLQHRLQARIGDLRRADLVDQPLVFGLQPVEQRAHVLVGQQLRQVVADDLAQMREQDRHVVDGREASRFSSLAKVSGTHIGLHAEGGLAHLVARQRRACGPSPMTTRTSPSRSSCAGDDGAVDPDLVALGRHGEIVGELDLRNDEAVLRWRTCAASWRRAAPARHATRQECAGKLLAEAELDLDGLQHLLDRLRGPPPPRAAGASRALAFSAARTSGPALAGWRRRRSPWRRRATRTAAAAGPGARASTNISDGGDE